MNKIERSSTGQTKAMQLHTKSGHNETDNGDVLCASALGMNGVTKWYHDTCQHCTKYKIFGIRDKRTGRINKIMWFYFICSVDSRPMTSSSTHTHCISSCHIVSYLQFTTYVASHAHLRTKCIQLQSFWLHCWLYPCFLFLWSIDVDDKQNRFVRNRFMARTMHHGLAQQRRPIRPNEWHKSVRLIWCETICYDLLVLCWRVPGISAPIRFEPIKLYLTLRVHGCCNARSH